MCEWQRAKDGPLFLFRCKVCHMLKRRDSSGRWRYFADAETRKRWRERPYRRNHVQHINILQMTSTGWSYETYSWPPGHGKIERRKEGVDVIREEENADGDSS
jgi:hypothetical protein